jgi:hypothetical protein
MDGMRRFQAAWQGFGRLQGGGGGDAACGSSAGVCVGRKRGKGGGERYDKWVPPVSGCGLVLGGRQAFWAERPDWSFGSLAGGEKRSWSGGL